MGLLEIDRQKLLKSALSGSSRSEIGVRQILSEKKIDQLDKDFQNPEEMVAAVNHILGSMQHADKISDQTRMDINSILDTEII